MHPESILQEIKSTTEPHLHSAPVPTGKLGSAMRLLRGKGKGALRMSADQEEIKKLGEKLEYAIEEFGVRTLSSRIRVRAHSMCQVISSMSVELVVEDVRALCVLLSKRIEEMNRERSQTAMNGT
jgi:hypothetical protein